MLQILAMIFLILPSLAFAMPEPLVDAITPIVSLIARMTPPQDGNGDPSDSGAISFDREALREMLKSLEGWGGPKASEIVDHLQEAHLIRGTDRLNVFIFFDEPVTVEFRQRADTPEGQIYGIHVPKRLHLAIAARDGRIDVVDLAEGTDPLRVMARLPIFQFIYPRGMLLDMVSGDLRVAGGIGYNWIGFVAKAQVLDKRFEGIDLWGTLLENLRFLKWPELVFE